MAKPKIIIGTKLILIIGLITIFLISMNSCVGAISEERDVSGFDKVTLSGSGDLIIEQGDTESLTVTVRATSPAHWIPADLLGMYPTMPR